MSKFDKTNDLVLEMLKKYPKSRTDDFKLYGCVLHELGINLNTSLKDFLKTAKELKMPAFATVTKCRRTLQGAYPELRDEETYIARQNEQGEYIMYNNKIFGGN